MGAEIEKLTPEEEFKATILHLIDELNTHIEVFKMLFQNTGNAVYLREIKRMQKKLKELEELLPQI